MVLNRNEWTSDADRQHVCNVGGEQNSPEITEDQDENEDKAARCDGNEQSHVVDAAVHIPCSTETEREIEIDREIDI